MFTKEELLKRISDGLAVLEVSTRNRGWMHLLDQNIIAESFCGDMLNIIYGYNLVNLNLSQGNYPGIDLGDQQLGVSVQVTSDKTSNKMKDAVERFITHGLDTKYKTLKVFVLGRKQGSYKVKIDTKNKVQFDPNKDVIDFKDLIKNLQSLNVEKLKKLSDLMDAEFKPWDTDAHILKQTDKEALEVYRAAFNRPALQDPISIEGSMAGLEVALTDLIGLLQTGELKGKIVAKSMNKFGDTHSKKSLDAIYHKVRELRSYYKLRLETGEIIVVQNHGQCKDSKTYSTFDNLKQSVVDDFNTLLSSHGLPSIRGVS
jgi:hypothetical protein